MNTLSAMGVAGVVADANLRAAVRTEEKFAAAPTLQGKTTASS